MHDIRLHLPHSIYISTKLFSGTRWENYILHPRSVYAWLTLQYSCTNLKRFHKQLPFHPDENFYLFVKSCKMLSQIHSYFCCTWISWNFAVHTKSLNMSTLGWQPSAVWISKEWRWLESRKLKQGEKRNWILHNMKSYCMVHHIKAPNFRGLVNGGDPTLRNTSQRL